MPGRCGNYRRAGLGRKLARDVAVLPQRCPGFAAREGAARGPSWVKPEPCMDLPIITGDPDAHARVTT